MVLDPGAESNDASWSNYEQVYDSVLQTHVLQIGPSSRSTFIHQNIRVPAGSTYFFFGAAAGLVWRVLVVLALERLHLLHVACALV